jgi:hypothetical protein
MTSTGGRPVKQRVFPNGSCQCGCGRETSPTQLFIVGHDRKAEAAVIREYFGNTAGLLAWVAAGMPMAS